MQNVAVIIVAFSFSLIPLNANAIEPRDEWKSATHFPLPPTKEGCTVRIYFLSEYFFQNPPEKVRIVDRKEQVFDFSHWFRESGLPLGQDEYAFAHAPTGKVVVMTTPPNQDLVSAMWHD